MSQDENKKENDQEQESTDPYIRAFYEREPEPDSEYVVNDDGRKVLSYKIGKARSGLAYKDTDEGRRHIAELNRQIEEEERQREKRDKS